MAKRHKSSRTNRKKNQKLATQTTSKPMTETLLLAHDDHATHEDIHEKTSIALQDKFTSNRNTSSDTDIHQTENKNNHQSSDSDETNTITTTYQNHEQHEIKESVLSEDTSVISPNPSNPLDYSGEQEYHLEEPQLSTQTVYSLDAHYDENHETSTMSFQTQSMESTPPPTLAEYEQLKRKNRRRLVGAGALVLVAGSLFAASSNSKNESTPTLNPSVKQVEAPIEPDILYPSGASRPVVAQFNLDDSKNTPVNISEKRTRTTQAANLSQTQSPSKNNQINQQVDKTKTNETITSTPRKNITSNGANTPTNTNQNAIVSTEKRKEPDNAIERLKKAQAVSAQLEQQRLNKEKATADKARAAQLAADKARNETRAKLEQSHKVQLPSERAATEKQRAQRQAAEREKTSTTKNTFASPFGQQRTIQAGAFTDKASAQRRQQQLRDLNMSARLEEVQTNKGTIYRVKTGNFNNAEQAEQALSRLQNKGVKGIVVGK